jgi:hypothetical protein
MNYKVRIKDKEHSIRMQKWAFQNGFKWNTYGTQVEHTDNRIAAICDSFSFGYSVIENSVSNFL